MSWKTFTFFYVFLLYFNLLSASHIFRSPVLQVNLIELYTSQGCSSCPPAELWLNGLSKKKELWNTVVPLAFHVTYWDDLGWKDPFARQEFTDRQYQAVQQWQKTTAYTPQFILNGKEYADWFKNRALPPVTGIKTGILEIFTEDLKKFSISFLPRNQKITGWRVSLAWLGCGLATTVEKGENQGKLLNQDFVVLILKEKLLESQTSQVNTEIELPPPATSPYPLAIACWVSNKDDHEPLQATGGFVLK